MTSITICLLSLTITTELSADVISVCEAIENRLELNGKAVKIRGVWGWSDSGSDLQAVIPCDRPTIVDGWLFSDTIDVNSGDWTVAGEYVGGGYVAKLRSLQKKHGYDVKVIATLSGRLQARAHFKTFVRFGEEFPEAYGYYSVAGLRFSRADDYQVVPYAQGELDRGYERQRRPMPKRVIPKEAPSH